MVGIICLKSSKKFELSKHNVKICRYVCTINLLKKMEKNPKNAISYKEIGKYLISKSELSYDYLSLYWSKKVINSWYIWTSYCCICICISIGGGYLVRYPLNYFWSLAARGRAASALLALTSGGILSVVGDLSEHGAE